METRSFRMFPFRGSKTGIVRIKAMRLHLLCRKISLIESNAKWRYPKKLTFKGRCLSHPVLGFCLGWCSNFVGSESGQKQSVNLFNSSRIWSPTQFNTPRPLPDTHCLYTVLWLWEGEGWTREKVREAIVHKAGLKIPTWLYLQFLNSFKHQ